MRDDAELLRSYAETQVETDFAELVRRHVNLVYSAALRQVGGDAHLAQDVTQTVFTDLARKAGEVARYRVLAGWLFTSTRFAAAKAVRGERRRRAREQEAQLMQEIFADDPAARLDWARVRPVLDEALGELGATDREAILLRFFEGRDYAAVGVRTGLSEGAARMRVERALDKLRTVLSRRGVSSTSAALATVLASQAVIAAPAGLATAVTAAAVTGGAAAAGAGAGAGAWITFMSMNKLQMGFAGALAIAGATGFVVQGQENAALRSEVATLRQDTADMATLRAENERLARQAADVAAMRNDDAELARLGDEATGLKARMQRVAQASAARTAAAQANNTGTPLVEVYDISKLDRQPRAVSQARPQYPFEMRRAGVTGSVLVDFIVTKEGDVMNAYAIKSSQREFEAAAVQAVSQWKFQAGQKGGSAVNTHMQVPIVFQVSGKEAPAPMSAPANTNATRLEGVTVQGGDGK